MNDATNRLEVHLEFDPAAMPGLAEAARTEAAALLRDFIAKRLAFDELADLLPDDPPDDATIDAVLALIRSVRDKHHACDEAAQRLCLWFRKHDRDRSLVLLCDGRYYLYTHGSIVCIDARTAIDVSNA